MTVPTYEDLTPGIPDIAETRLSEQLTMFLKGGLRRRTGDQEKKTVNVPDRLLSCLYACLRTANREPQTLLAVARDFSPRVMRVSENEVLLDVSGLGALIGAPPVIASE